MPKSLTVAELWLKPIEKKYEGMSYICDGSAV